MTFKTFSSDDPAVSTQSLVAPEPTRSVAQSGRGKLFRFRDQTAACRTRRWCRRASRRRGRRLIAFEIVASGSTRMISRFMMVLLLRAGCACRSSVTAGRTLGRFDGVLITCLRRRFVHVSHGYYGHDRSVRAVIGRLGSHITSHGHWSQNRAGGRPCRGSSAREHTGFPDGRPSTDSLRIGLHIGGGGTTDRERASRQA